MVVSETIVFEADGESTKNQHSPFSAKSIDYSHQYRLLRQKRIQDERKCDLSCSRDAVSHLVTVKSILKPVYATNFTIEL